MRGPRAGLGERVAWTAAVVLPLAVLGVFFAWPVATLVGRGLWADGHLDLTGFGEVLSRPRTLRIAGQTLAQAAAGTIVCVLTGVPGALVLYRRRLPGRDLLRGIVAVPFVLPSVVVGVAFHSLVTTGGPLGGAGLDGTMAAVVAALVFFNYGFVVRTVGSLWVRLDPRPLQAARALGASPVRAFLTVTLPSLAPAIASAASVTFLFCATAYGVVLVLGGAGVGTIETEIYTLTAQYLDLRGAAVLSVVQVCLIAVALWVADRARRRSEARLVLRADVPPEPLGRGDVGAVVLTAVMVCGLLGVPIATLLARSLRRSGQWTLANYRDLATTGGDNALTVTVWQATATSARMAVAAALIALVVGGAVALVVSRRPRSVWARRGVGLLDAAFILPLGVSAVTVGFGFLITLARPPLALTRSWWVVPIAQAVVAVPLVVRTLLPALRAIDPRQREAAAALGAGPGRVLAGVDGPQLMRSGGMALGFALATSMGEFGAASFLVRPRMETLPVVVFRLIGRPGAANQGMALAAAVVLAVGTAVVMLLCEIGSSRARDRESWRARSGDDPQGSDRGTGRSAEPDAQAGVRNRLWLRRTERRAPDGELRLVLRPRGLELSGPGPGARAVPGASGGARADGERVGVGESAVNELAGSPLSGSSVVPGLSIRGLRVIYRGGDGRTPDLARGNSRSRARELPISRQGVVAVDGVDLDVAPGEVVALLGASGSGKSSLLRAVAGLEDVAGGTITWDGRDMVTVPVHRRGFVLMFQDGQLFTHRSVAGNVAYGLASAGVARSARARVVEEMLELVGLPGYGARPVTTLSGGQAQRVALARALAPRPRLLLLDEPLSALDRALREQLAVDLRRILRERGTTALHVTHDQDEAMTVADRVGIMADGRLLRLAPPAELWRDPGVEDVARFLGFGPILRADDAARLGLPGHGYLALAPGALTVVGPGQAGEKTGVGGVSGTCAAGVEDTRDEVEVAASGAAGPASGVDGEDPAVVTVSAQVRAVRVRRGVTEVEVGLAGQDAAAAVPVGMVPPEPGTAVRLAVDPARTARLTE